MHEENTNFRISTWAHTWGDPILHLLGQSIAKVGITPNHLTIFGFLLCSISGFLLSRGNLMWAGYVLMLAGFCDVLDGPLAHISNQKSLLGSFLDSVLDQYSDVLLFAGLTWFYLEERAALEIILIVLTLAGALMVSYIKAKANSLGIECSDGPIGRFERTLLTIVGLILRQPLVLLATLVVLTNYTAIRRFILVVIRIKELREEKIAG